METQEKKVNIAAFYYTTQKCWKNGAPMEVNPLSNKLAEANSFDDFIKIINGMTGNSIRMIDDKTGFLENEFLLYAVPDKLIVTNKRYFISPVNDIHLGFDYYCIEEIKSIRGIQQNTILLFELINKNAVYTNFDNSFIMDILDNAPFVLPSENIIKNTSTINYEHSKDRVNHQKKYIKQRSIDANKKDEEFPMIGTVVGSIGLLAVILYFLPHDRALNKFIGIAILIVGAIIGANIQIYFRDKNPDD